MFVRIFQFVWGDNSLYVALSPFNDEAVHISSCHQHLSYLSYYTPVPHVMDRISHPNCGVGCISVLRENSYSSNGPLEILVPSVSSSY